MIISLLVYAIICVIGYVMMSQLYKNNAVEALTMPKSEWLYYFIQFTWGLLANLLGGIIAIVLICCRFQPYWYGRNWGFALPINSGMSLGIFFFGPENASTHLKNHEHGHSIQNFYFGPLFLGMIAIPSVVRFWIREIMTRKGKKPKTKYDDIWFEGQATKTGDKFINSLK